MHPDVSFPVYAVLFGGKVASRGSLRGMVQLPLPGNRASAETLEWFKPARPLDKSFPEGFTLNPSASFGQ